jgi:metal-responsive CopG/Arc/MetJ family transcriptional regulator
MPRRRLTDPPKRTTINLPESLLARVELHLFDPVRVRRKYGGLSNLIARLLREELERVAEEEKK